MKEQSLLNAIIHYLSLHGFKVWRQNQGGVKTEYKGKPRFFRFSYCKGISDIIGVSPSGKFTAIEVKRPGKKPTDDQAEFIEDVQRLGGHACVAYGIEDVEDIVRKEKG